MSATAVPAPQTDEDRRAPPVTLAEVLAACHELERAGGPVTRRLVRDKIGRGSMTTIHNGVSQYESRQASAPPSIDLTPEDRTVIADLGARALAVAEGRVERVLAEREAVLQAQIAAANARADDAVAAAEFMVSEEQRRTAEAVAATEAALLERDRARSEAEDAIQRALRLEGQLAQLMAEKEEMTMRGAQMEADLAAARMHLATETALRQRWEADFQASAQALNALRAEQAEQARQSAENLGRIKEALAAEKGRLAGMTEERGRLDEAMKRLEGELSLRDAALSTMRADLAGAQAAVAASDKAAHELAVALASEQAKAQQLALVLTAVTEQTQAVRLLEASLSARQGPEPNGAS